MSEKRRDRVVKTEARQTTKRPRGRFMNAVAREATNTSNSKFSSPKRGRTPGASAGKTTKVNSGKTIAKQQRCVKQKAERKVTKGASTKRRRCISKTGEKRTTKEAKGRISSKQRGSVAKTARRTNNKDASGRYNVHQYDRTAKAGVKKVCKESNDKLSTQKSGNVAQGTASDRAADINIKGSVGKFSIDRSNDAGGRIGGILVLSDRIIVGESTNKNLSIFDLTGTVLSSVHSVHFISGIAKLGHNQFATCGDDDPLIRFWALRGNSIYCENI